MIFEIEIPSVLYKIYESGWLIYGNDWFLRVLEISSLNWYFIRIRLFTWSNANRFYTLLFLCYIFNFVRNEALIDHKIEINFSWYEKWSRVHK